MLSEEQIYEYLEKQEDQQSALEFLQILTQEVLEQEEHWEIIQSFLYKQLGLGLKLQATQAYKILRILLKTENSKVLDYQKQLLKENVHNLGSSDAGIRKNSHNINQFIIKLLSDFDPILEVYLEEGLKNPDPLIQQKSANSLQSLMINHHTYLQESNQLKLIHAALTKNIQEGSNSIIRASEQALITIQKLVITYIQGFMKKEIKECVQQKDFVLQINQNQPNIQNQQFYNQQINQSIQNQQQINFSNNQDTIQLKNQIQIQHNQQLFQQNLQFQSQSNQKEFQNIQIQKEQKIEGHGFGQGQGLGLTGLIQVTQIKQENIVKNEVQNQSELYFNRIINLLEEQQDYQVLKLKQIRQNAIEELDQFIENYHTNKIILKTLETILNLLDDANFKICVTASNIILKLSTFQEIQYLFQDIVKKVFSKLGDSKMAMRSQSQRIIKSLFEVLKEFLIQYLQNQKKIPQDFWIDKCLEIYEIGNYNSKDSILNLILFFQNHVDYEHQYNKLVQTISYQYSDQKEKLRQLIQQVLTQLSQKISYNQLKNFIQDNFNDAQELFVLFKIQPSPIFPQLNPNRTITSEISQQLHSRSSQRFPQDQQSPKRFMSPNFTTNTDSYKLFESQNVNTDYLNHRTSHYESTTISINSRLFKNENNTESCFRIASANHQDGPSDKKNTSAFVLKEGQILNYSLQKNLDDFQSDNFQNKTQKIPAQVQPQTQISVNLGSLQQKVLKTQMNLIIESKEVQNKQVQKRNLISQDIICIKEKEDDEEDNLSQDKNERLDIVQPKYQTVEELKPLSKPQQELKQIPKDLKSDDWQLIFNAFNYLRRIIKHNPELITNQNISIFLPEIINNLDCLRSGIAKIALLTLQEITQYGKLLDNFIDKIFVKLFKKSLDSNDFIQSQVQQSMIAICQECNETKIISWLFNQGNSSKIYQQKLLILIGLEKITIQNKNKIQNQKDIDKILQIVCQCVFDSHQDVRSSAKELFLKIRQAFLKYFNLISYQEFIQLIQKSLNENLQQQIMNFLKNQNSTQEFSHFIIRNQTNLKKKSINESPFQMQNQNDNATGYEQQEEKVIKKKSAQIKMKEPQDFDELQSIYSQSDSQDWKTRFNSIKLLQNLCEKNSDYLQKSKHFQKFLDYYLKLITDQNSKISIQALSSFKSVIDLIMNGIQSNLSITTNSIFNCLGSNNQQIKILAEDLVDKIYQKTDVSTFFLCLIHGIQFANLKARSNIIFKIIGNKQLIDYLQSQNQVNSVSNIFLQKNLVNLTVKLCDDKQTEIRQAAIKLLIQIGNIIGKNTLIQLIPVNKHSFL